MQAAARLGKAFLRHIGLPKGRFLAKLKSGGNAVFHIEEAGRPFLLKLFVSPALCRREAMVLQLLASEPLVPRLLSSGTAPPGVSFILMEWKEGENLASRLPGLPSAPRRRAFEEAARFGARMSEIEPSGLPMTPLAQFVSGGDDLATALAPLEDHLGSQILERLVAGCEAWIERLRGEPLVFGHGDYQPKNLLADPSGRLTAVLDWERAGVSTPWEDAGCLLRHAVDESMETAVLSAWTGAGDNGALLGRARASDLLHISLWLVGPFFKGQDLALWRRLVNRLLLLVEGGPAPDTP